MPDDALPATSLSMVGVASDVTVLKATVSPTTSALSPAAPFFSISLELETAYVVVPVLVLMDTLEVPTAVTVPWRGRGAAPGGAPGLCAALAGAVVELALDPAVAVFPVVVAVVVAAPALLAVAATAPAIPPTPNRASPLIMVLFNRRRPPRPRSAGPRSPGAGTPGAG